VIMQQRWVIVISVVVLIVVGIIGAALIFGGGDNDGDDTNDSGALTVTEAWVRATVGLSADADQVTGAFMVIENRTDRDETLVSAAVDPAIASVVEIHETTLDDNDVMQMRPIEGGVVVPSMGNLVLKPGAYHIMLIDVQRELTPGDMITVTLTFESGTQIAVEAEVRDLGSE
jgi:periplasmic copper chaperone A